MSIRRATHADVEQMVALSDLKRTQYQAYAPTFWRKAADANERQAAFFAHQLDRDQVIALVHETGGQIDGFIIAAVREAPPVYDPGTAICTVDDFGISPAQDWSIAGSALLAAARQEARFRGAELAVVVCGRQDESKRAMLQQSDFKVASEWYVNPL
jgi:hypothetical protein